MLSALGLLIYIAVIARSEGGQCQQNPLRYASKKLSESNNAFFQGSGYFIKENSPTIYFNQNNQSIIYKGSPEEEVNWGSLTFKNQT